MPNDSPLREPVPHLPAYRRHKPSGQAVVTLTGREIYAEKNLHLAAEIMRKIE